MNIRHSSILGPHRSLQMRRLPRHASRGFTLVELLVVLAIMAIVTSVTVGAFRSLSDNNQRVTCQTNLTQVYQGLRLYMADEDAQPPLYFPNAQGFAKKDPKHIGLWQLWTYADKANPDEIAPLGTAPTARYMRSTNFLHCPSDSEPGVELRKNVELYEDATKQKYNKDFLSYQMYATNVDDQPYSSSDKPSDIPTDAASQAKFQTYLPERISTYSNAVKEPYKRQLRQVDPSFGATTLPKRPDPLKRPALDNTIVTWCRHHRATRDYDNVLFFDGSVQFIARKQDKFAEDGSCNVTGVLEGADRVPRRADCGQ